MLVFNRERTGSKHLKGDRKGSVNISSLHSYRYQNFRAHESDDLVSLNQGEFAREVARAEGVPAAAGEGVPDGKSRTSSSVGLTSSLMPAPFHPAVYAHVAVLSGVEKTMFMFASIEGAKLLRLLRLGSNWEGTEWPAEPSDSSETETESEADSRGLSKENGRSGSCSEKKGWCWWSRSGLG